MKLHTETYTLPSFWAGYLINGDTANYEDTEIKQWLIARPWLGECLSCSEREEFRWNNDANDLGGHTLDFTFPVKVYEEVSTPNGSYKRLVYPATVETEMLEWQKKGLQYTSTGYGHKIPTTKVLRMFGRKYRVYCKVFSNIGTTYIIYQGFKVLVP